MKNSRAFATALLMSALLISVFGAGSTGAGALQKIKPPTATMTSPRNGEVFIPGDQVTIAWDVKEGNVSFCEQELHLMVNGGKEWIRLTRELGDDVRQFEWTVPDIPTENAMIEISLGCDRRPYLPFEGVNIQSQAVFQILPARNGHQSVEVASPEKTTVQPGDDVPVRWKSSVEDVEAFEVMVSYDRGAHFHSVGETRDTSMVWSVPKDFSGTVAFTVVARKSNGARVEAVPGSGSMIDIKRQQ